MKNPLSMAHTALLVVIGLSFVCIMSVNETAATGVSAIPIVSAARQPKDNPIIAGMVNTYQVGANRVYEFTDIYGCLFLLPSDEGSVGGIIHSPNCPRHKVRPWK